MDLAELILHLYPWWEMQRVRQLSLGAQASELRNSNEWRHTRNLVDHAYRGVTTPNCDTLYSGAWLDLANGPILIDIPASDLPYWSIAVLDLNTDNIALLGSRYPGSQSLLVCGPDYQGKTPNNMQCVRSSSMVAWVLARFLIGNDALVTQAEAMRRSARFRRLQPDGQFSADVTFAPRVPLVAAARNNPENFWRVIRLALDEDSALPEMLAEPLRQDIHVAWPVGVNDWSQLDAQVQAHFVQAFAQVSQRVKANNSGNIKTLGQWRFPGKDIGNFGANAMYRAEVSLWGLGALPLNEVIYLSAYVDEKGVPLHGSHTYRFRIPPDGIPAQAFWSLTMYEVDAYGGMYFTANPLKRYAIGDRTEGLTKNSDGSIDIWISHTAPLKSEQYSNWLPAPLGEFRLMIRAYAPSEAFVRGQTLPPAVEKWVN